MQKDFFIYSTVISTELLSKYQMFKKLSPISHIHKNRYCNCRPALFLLMIYKWIGLVNHINVYEEVSARSAQVHWPN